MEYFEYHANYDCQYSHVHEKCLKNKRNTCPLSPL